MAKSIISERLKVLRKSKKITQKELSEILNISYSSIIDYENGRRKPNAKALSALEQFFGVSGAYILGDTEEKEPLFIWQDKEVMDAVQETFPLLIEQLLTSILGSTDFEQKMMYDIFVELLHVLKNESPSTKAAAISLLQESFSVTTRFIDICSHTNLTDYEDNRLSKAKQACIKDYEAALNEAIKNLT